MQTVHSASPRSTPLPLPSQAPTEPRGLAKSALKWVGAALDPRHSARFVGRAGAALAALALQAPRAGATAAPPCWDYRNFQSPAPNPETFGIRAGCGAVRTYQQDFVNKCGAQPTSSHNPEFWHSVKNWVGTAQLYSQSHDPQPSNSSFIPCLIAVGSAESKHQNKVGGIIAGAALGGLAVLLGAAWGVGYCCNKRREAKKRARDVEAGNAGNAGQPVPAPLPALLHTVPMVSAPQAT